MIPLERRGFMERSHSVVGATRWLHEIKTAVENRLAECRDGKERRKLKRIRSLAVCVHRFRDRCEACRCAGVILEHLAFNATTAESKAEHARMIRSIVRHLRRTHRLFPCGYRAVVGALFGACGGVAAVIAFAAIPSSLPPFTTGGVALNLGLLTGLLLDLEARREGRVL